MASESEDDVPIEPEPILFVFPNGTKVMVGNSLGESLQGTITGIWVTGNDTVQYRVSWWIGHERREEWMTRDEVHLPLPGTTTRIGFIKL